MPYQSRTRYTSRVERFRKHVRAYRLIILLGVLLVVLYLAFNWRTLYDTWRTARLE